MCLFRWEPVEVLQFGLVRSNRTETPSAEATRGDVAIEVNCPIDCELSGDCEEAVRPSRPEDMGRRQSALARVDTIPTGRPS